MRWMQPITPDETAESAPNYLSSVSDLMAGLLFLFILTITVFSLSLAHQEELFESKVVEKQTEIDKLKNTDQARNDLLRYLEERLREEHIHVEIDPRNGVLHLPEAILFESGSDEFNPGGYAALGKLAAILGHILPYYAANTGLPVEDIDRINPFRAILDAVFIEGHTDDRPIRNSQLFKSNWELSASRAIHTFQILTETRPDLQGLLNKKGQPLFGFSGYADTRPVRPNDSEENRMLNRRIDIRFIMALPGNTDEIPHDHS